MHIKTFIAIQNVLHWAFNSISWVLSAFMLRRYILFPHGCAHPSWWGSTELDRSISVVSGIWTLKGGRIRRSPSNRPGCHAVFRMSSDEISNFQPSSPHPPMQSLVLAAEPGHDKRFYLPTSQCSKSIPPWPGSHWLKETMSLIKTGRGPANMAHPFFPAEGWKKEKNGRARKKNNKKRGERAMWPRNRGIPWIKSSLFSLSP